MKLNKISCQVSQSDIDMVAVIVPDINLHATKNLAPDERVITDLVKQVNKAFKIEEQNHCGLMDYVLLPEENTD